MQPTADPLFWTIWDPLLSSVIAGLLLVIPLWRIFARTGLAGAWSLVIFVPWVGTLLVLLALAFTRWPNDPMPREVEGA